MEFKVNSRGRMMGRFDGVQGELQESRKYLIEFTISSRGRMMGRFDGVQGELQESRKYLMEFKVNSRSVGGVPPGQGGYPAAFCRVPPYIFLLSRCYVY